MDRWQRAWLSFGCVVAMGAQAQVPAESPAPAQTPATARAAPATPAVDTTPSSASVPTVLYLVVGDAIPEPVSNTAGDVARGRAIVANRRVGQCLLCHAGPFPDSHLQGNLAPSLAGAGTRFSAGQLRLRIADAQRLNPRTTMPSYHRIHGHDQVAAAWRGRPALDAQQVEDVVAFLGSLKD